MSRLLQDHHRVQPRSNCGSVRRLLYCPLPADRRESSFDRRMLLQEETALDGDDWQHVTCRTQRTSNDAAKVVMQKDDMERVGGGQSMEGHPSVKHEEVFWCSYLLIILSKINLGFR